jgi:OmpA-OmpF porin, OOP family
MKGCAMKARSLVVAILIASTTLSGCEFGRRFARKEWGKGTYIPAAVCAVVGGVAGAAIESKGFTNESIRSGHSSASENGSSSSKSDKPDYPAAAGIGAGAGALLCGLAGHYLWDQDKPATPTPMPTLPPVPTPTAMPLPPPSGKHIVLRGVHFDFNKSDIRADSRPVLDEAVSNLNENPNVRVSVEGHTDGIGSVEYNQQLSVRRAEAVFRYLVNHGVAPERMEVAGFGKSRPVAENETESGRAQNRRVELHVENQPEGTAP